MTDTEAADFIRRLTVLAEVYGEPMSPVRIAGYTQLLADQAYDELVPALEACAKVCTFFPKPIDILDAIANVRYERDQAQTKKMLVAADTLAREQRYHCTACEDTGFVRGLDCPGDGRCAVAHCGQPGHVSYSHGYTRKCHCRADNPVLKAQRERLLVNAAKEKHERHHAR